MKKFLTNKLSVISFIFIPIIFLWHPNWLGFLGVQPLAVILVIALVND